MLRFSLIQSHSKVTEHFYNCEKKMPSERTGMAFEEIIFRIIQFADTFMLIINFSSIWPDLSEIGQIFFELQLLRTVPTNTEVFSLRSL